MNYMRHHEFTKKRHERSRVFIHKKLDDESQKILAKIAFNNLKNLTKKQNIETKKINHFNVISKTNKFRHRNNAIRTTLGMQRRGSYDWNIAGVYNQLKLSHLPYIPSVYCYGYKRNDLRFVTSITFISEFKNNTLNIIEFIEKYPNLISPALEASFDIILEHLGHDYIHLDLWAGNILVTEDLSMKWLIDFEYCRFKPKKPLEEKLGFCLGYFHIHTICNYISLSDYKIILNEWLLDKSLLIDKKRTLTNAVFFAKTKIDRKDRFKYF